MKARKVRYHLCDFCAHDTGSYKDDPVECSECLAGCNFLKVDKMSPRQLSDWNCHNMLDEYINNLDVVLLPWQQLLLHNIYNARLTRSYVIYPRHNGYTYYKLLVEQFIDTINVKQKGELK